MEIEEYETVLVSNGHFIYASTHYLLDSTKNITTTVVDNTPLNLLIKRRKREAIGGNLPDGCKYVFADGSRDARDNKELSIQQKFFDLQYSGIKDFIIKLNITKKVWDGRKNSYSYGTAYMNIFINDPPENGTCTIKLPSSDSAGKEVCMYGSY